MKKIELEVVTITQSVSQAHSFAVILAEKGGKKRIPIVIGNAEAQAIAIALENIKPSRPLTHDLLKEMLDHFHAVVSEVIIHNLVDGIFYSTVVLSYKTETIEFDSRTSDAIAIATRFKCPIYTYPGILEAAGLEVNESGQLIASTEESHQGSDVEQEEESSIEELEKKLSEALENEDYELAARLRDELNKRK